MYKKLQQQLEFLNVQEEYIKVSNKPDLAIISFLVVVSQTFPYQLIDDFSQNPKVLNSEFIKNHWICTSCKTKSSICCHLRCLCQDEQKNLKREYKRAQEEVKRIQSVPLVIGQVGKSRITPKYTGFKYTVPDLPYIKL